MINKDTYKRFTELKTYNNGKKNYVQYSVSGCYNDMNGKGDYTTGDSVDRLAELEDKITDGTLIEIDKSLIGQGIVGIHHFTDGTYQLDLDENIVIGFSSDGVITWNETHYYNDEFINGMFFMDNEKGKSEAEAKLKELHEGKK